MQCQHIDVVPGESVRIGNLIVTIVSVRGTEVAMTIEEDGNPGGMVCEDPESWCGNYLGAPVLV
jgi:hypothetical protein